jgi:hypothetical protein
MNVENIIRAWKADEDHWEAPVVASPVGHELTEEELLEVSGAACTFTICPLTNCGDTCGNGHTCVINTCNSTVCVFSTIYCQTTL